MSSSSKILILGGGFGGLYTALRLSQLAWSEPPEITLIDKRDRFLFLPLLYELLTDELQTWEIAPPFVELLSDTPVKFVQGEVQDVDIETQSVTLSSGQQFSYERLVLAVGGETPVDLVPGTAEYALPFRSLEDAYQLKAKLQTLEKSDRDRIRVAIVGAGYSGVELACKLSDRLGERGRVRLVEMGPDILQTAAEFNREAAKKALETRQVWLDLETTVAEISSETLTLNYKSQKDELPVDLVLWTVGNRIPHWVTGLPLPHTAQGQLEITPELQVKEHSELYALGDLAYCQDATGQQVASTAQSALQQADYCAWNLWGSLCDRPLLPFRYQHLGEMLSLGVDNATLTGLGLKLDGPFGYLARRLTYLYRLPTLDHQLRVGISWLTTPLTQWLQSGDVSRDSADGRTS
ncbi:MAG: NAD(P)/FAD-dependent oxidoreductase [Cyanobacteria bacterium P01_H01_bin.15]